MRAIVVEQSGGPEQLLWQEVPEPTLNSDEILVTTAATGVNFIETYQRSGVYSVTYPFTPGSEAAGTVTAVGSQVTRFAVGDRVTTSLASATYAEQFVVQAALATRIPEGLDWSVAAALPLQGSTAHYLSTSSANPQAGETVLVHAGAGGVGLILTQLLTARGVRVITTASTQEKRDLSRAAGAIDALPYEDIAQQVRELTSGAGVSVVYDGVGKETFDGSLDSLAIRGTLVLFGGASGQVPPFDLQRLNSGGSLSITRPTAAHFMRTPEERDWRFSELFAALETGALALRIGARYPLADANLAHIALEGRATTGKVLLMP